MRRVFTVFVRGDIQRQSGDHTPWASSIRFRTWMATAISVVRRLSLRKRALADHLFITSDFGLDPAALVVPDAFCQQIRPFSVLPEMAVALCGFGLSRLARHSRGTWRHDHRSIRSVVDDDAGG
jgi:hypothetical protein